MPESPLTRTFVLFYAVRPKTQYLDQGFSTHFGAKQQAARSSVPPDKNPIQPFIACIPRATADHVQPRGIGEPGSPCAWPAFNAGLGDIPPAHHGRADPHIPPPGDSSAELLHGQPGQRRPASSAPTHHGPEPGPEREPRGSVAQGPTRTTQTRAIASMSASKSVATWADTVVRVALIAAR